MLGIFKIRTTYLFSQRRTDIQNLIDARTQKIREDERKRALKQFANLSEVEDFKPGLPTTPRNGAYPVLED